MFGTCPGFREEEFGQREILNLFVATLVCKPENSQLDSHLVGKKKRKKHQFPFSIYSFLSVTDRIFASFSRIYRIVQLVFFAVETASVI